MITENNDGGNATAETGCSTMDPETALIAAAVEAETARALLTAVYDDPPAGVDETFDRRMVGALKTLERLVNLIDGTLSGGSD